MSRACESYMVPHLPPKVISKKTTGFGAAAGVDPTLSPMPVPGRNYAPVGSELVVRMRYRWKDERGCGFTGGGRRRSVPKTLSKEAERRSAVSHRAGLQVRPGWPFSRTVERLAGFLTSHDSPERRSRDRYFSSPGLPMCSGRWSCRLDGPLASFASIARTADGGGDLMDRAGSEEHDRLFRILRNVQTAGPSGERTNQ